MTSRVALVVLLVALSAGRLSAQVPAGGEFRVNTYVYGDQWQTSIASDADGDFVVVWDSRYQDGSEEGVFGQRYHATGAHRGAEFRVNSYTTQDQNHPCVASDMAGNFVVAWTSYKQIGDMWDIFAQRYDASGTRRGSEFRVNTYTTNLQSVSSIASDAVGNFVIAWTGWGDGSGDGIFAQRYDASGAARGGEFQVNTYTYSYQWFPSVASDAAGNFVVVWRGYAPWPNEGDIFGQRYDATGVPRGGEFRVNTYVYGYQGDPHVASDRVGNFAVVWQSNHQDGDWSGIYSQRYDASGARLGGEFRVNAYTTFAQGRPSVASDAAGNFVVAWTSNFQDGSDWGVFAQRFVAAGVPRGAAFQVNSYTTWTQYAPSVASDAAGNFVVAWAGIGTSDGGVWGQRFGGLAPAALSADASPSAGSDGNDVLEPGETAVAVNPSWQNVNGATRTFSGVGSSFSGPSASGVSYALPDATGAYGTVPSGVTVQCTDCYEVGVNSGGTRPATHWDATFTERLTPDALGQTKPWALHVGESFVDVPKTSGYYRFVETLLHKGVTGGCAADSYCPASAVTREQMSVFVLVGKEGAGYLPQACVTPVFGDVPATSPYCRFIEDLSRRGVVSGCGGGNYCPTSPVTREQMPVFVLKVLDPTINPPACGTPVFADVPASSPYCRFIEELVRRGVVSGCGGGNYCPAEAVTREQMAVFISATFGLSLYGP